MKHCSGCGDGRSRRYNSRCYLHLLECISYRVYERIFFDGNLPQDLRATMEAFQRDPKGFFEAHPILTMTIASRLQQHALSSPHPNPERQDFRMKHIAPLVNLFNQLVTCAPSHIQEAVEAMRRSPGGGAMVDIPAGVPGISSGTDIPPQNFPASYTRAPPPPTTPMAKTVMITKKAYNQRLETAYPQIGPRGIITNKGRVHMLAGTPVTDRASLNAVWRGLSNGRYAMVFR